MQPNGYGVIVELEVTVSRDFCGSDYGSMRASATMSPMPQRTETSSYFAEAPQRTPQRHHSEYVYDPSLPIPEFKKNEIRQSLMEISMRGSMRASQGSDFDHQGEIRDS